MFHRILGYDSVTYKIVCECAHIVSGPMSHWVFDDDSQRSRLQYVEIFSYPLRWDLKLLSVSLSPSLSLPISLSIDNKINRFQCESDFHSLHSISKMAFWHYNVEMVYPFHLCSTFVHAKLYFLGNATQILLVDRALDVLTGYL